jgi:exodeoxyribonuclease V alpha subunit
LFIDSGDFDTNKSFNEYPKWHSLAYGYDIFEMVKKLYLEIIPKYYPGHKIQIISPMNKGVCGNNYINSIIRDIVNVPSEDKAEIDLKSRILRVGDLVMNLVNNYGIGITNGEMGVIKAINPEEKTAIVEFEYENKTVELKRSDLLHLTHSYSVSCHKYQGSESPIVIAPLSMAHYPLLYRSMLYTLISRGRNLVVILGQRNCLKIATENVRDNNRQTSLIELLKMKSF